MARCRGRGYLNHPHPNPPLEGEGTVFNFIPPSYFGITIDLAWRA